MTSLTTAGKVKTSITLTTEDLAWLKAYAHAQDRDVSYVLRELIRERREAVQQRERVA